MFGFCRRLFILGLLGFGYCLLVLVPLIWPWSGLLLGLAFYRLVWCRQARHTALGSARWADEGDLRRAGMLNAISGLPLGTVPASGDLFSRFRILFARQVADGEACRVFCAGGSGKRLVRLPGANHTIVVSPSGGGKGTGVAIPYLKLCEESCVVIDLKGEIARITAQHRKQFWGNEIVILDPYRQVTTNPDSFNPLQFIDRGDPLALDHCGDLANALVIRTGEEKELHWNDSAEAWLKGVIATVVYYGKAEEETRSLQTVRQIFSDPHKLDTAVKLMCESDAWDGMLARIGGQLLHYVDREKSSALTTVCRHLRFLDTLAIAESTRTSTFDPTALRKRRMTIYMVLPPEHLRAQSAMLRMWIGSFFRSVVQGGLQERDLVHFILDEAASLGHMEAIDDAVDKLRGYGVRLQFYYQSLGQLKNCWPNGQDQTLLSNTTQVFFGVNDPATADYVSARLGEETIVLESGGSSRGSSWQHGGGHCGQDSGSYSSNSNTNWQLQARKLLKPEEVLALPPRTAITFTPGVPPVLTTLLRYYEEKSLGVPPSLRERLVERCQLLLTAVFVAGFWLTAALLLTAAIANKVEAPGQRPPPYEYESQTFDRGSGVVLPARGRF